MVKIQVLGHGLIPRGHGIAPRKEPFEADLKLIKTILEMGTFKVNMVNPINGAKVPITGANFEKMYRAWDKYAAPEKEKKPVLHPTAPSVQPVRVESKEEVKEEPKVEEKKEESSEEKKNDNNNYHNDKKNKHNNNTFKPIVNPENN